MLKQLRFDLYKIVKSRFLQIYFIICASTCVLLPLLLNVLLGSYDKTQSFIDYIFGQGPFEVFFIIFAILITIKDFSSGFAKNIYTHVNKFFYVLSKFICIALFVIALYLFNFIVHFFLFICFSSAKIYDANSVKFSEFAIHTLVNIFVWTTRACFASFIASIFKNPFLPSVIILVYYFVVAGLIRDILVPAIMQKYFMEIVEKLYYGADSVTRYFLFALNPKNYSGNRYKTICSLVCVMWLVISYFGSWLLVRKKNV